MSSHEINLQTEADDRVESVSVFTRRIKALLERGARIAMLTGSGSAVFGIFDVEPPAAEGSPTWEWEEIRTATAAHVVPLERMD